MWEVTGGGERVLEPYLKLTMRIYIIIPRSEGACKTEIEQRTA